MGVFWWVEDSFLSLGFEAAAHLSEEEENSKEIN